MPLIRKRRATGPADTQSPPSSPPTTQPQPGRRQRREETTSTSPEMSDEELNSSGNANASSLNALVQKMVRFALASEYARLPIRRADISAKVLGEQGSRQFKIVFESAQRELRGKFGMEMTELPAREKVTISQRRAAQKTEKPSNNSNKSWILTSTLPPAYRTPQILPPTQAPSTATESTYTALYTFIIAVISLNGGSLGEQKLERYLARTNADTYTPLDRTDKFLNRLCKEGYLVRTKENDGGEEIVEYMVGPRGKVEVGSGGVAGLVREVYGRAGGLEDLTDAERGQREEFEGRLKRSLGLGVMGTASQGGSRGERGQGSGGAANEEGSSRRRQSSRRNAEDSEEEEEEDDDDEEDSD